MSARASAFVEMLLVILALVGGILWLVFPLIVFLAIGYSDGSLSVKDVAVAVGCEVAYLLFLYIVYYRRRR